MRSPRLIAPVLLSLALAAPGAPAQTVSGTVLDEASRRPIPLAAVSLLDASALVTTRARTDEQGAFRLHAPERGAYWVRVEHEGYSLLQSPPFVLDRADSATITLAVRPGSASPADAAVRADTERNRNYATFLGRRRFGRGIYRGPEALARNPVARLPATIDSMVAAQPHDPATGRLAMKARGCAPVVFLDGVRQGPDLLHFVPPHLVRAIEVYPDPRLVPNELWIGTNVCGAVALWTHEALGDEEPVRPPPAPATAARTGGPPLPISRSGTSRARPDLITREQLESAAFTNLYDVVRTLRPHWLSTRSTTFSTAERCAVVLSAAERRDCQARMQTNNGVQLHLDGQRLNGIEDLRGLPLAGVAYIQYFNATDAGARWGLDHTQGAILVATDTR